MPKKVDNPDSPKSPNVSKQNQLIKKLQKQINDINCFKRIEHLPIPQYIKISHKCDICNNNIVLQARPTIGCLMSLYSKFYCHICNDVSTFKIVFSTRSNILLGEVNGKTITMSDIMDCLNKIFPYAGDISDYRVHCSKCKKNVKLKLLYVCCKCNTESIILAQDPCDLIDIINIESNGCTMCKKQTLFRIKFLCSQKGCVLKSLKNKDMNINKFGKVMKSIEKK